MPARVMDIHPRREPFVEDRVGHSVGSDHLPVDPKLSIAIRVLATAERPTTLLLIPADLLPLDRGLRLAPSQEPHT
jgi:hypothetical protein